MSNMAVIHGVAAGLMGFMENHLFQEHKPNKPESSPQSSAIQVTERRVRLELGRRYHSFLIPRLVKGLPI